MIYKQATIKVFSLTFTDIFSQSQKIIILKLKKLGFAVHNLKLLIFFDLSFYYNTGKTHTHMVLILLHFFPRLFPDDMSVYLPCGLQSTGHVVLQPLFQNKQAPELNGEHQLFSSVLLILAFL